ncbi:MAG: hypothetical protein WAO52_05600 [Prolixibacteraceae bacterium]
MIREISKRQRLEESQNPKYLTENEIAGSPYLNKEFISGNILKINNSEIKDIPLRYNIYTNNFEFLKDSVVLNIVAPSEIAKITLNNQSFAYSRYITPKNIRYSYFQVISGGNYQLLKMYRVVFENADGKIFGSDSSRFVQAAPLYYLRYNNGLAHLIDSKKKLIKILQPIPEEIINFIQQQRTIIRDENKLIELLDLTNKTMK